MDDTTRRFEQRVRDIAAPLIDAAFDGLLERVLGPAPARVAAPRPRAAARVARPPRTEAPQTPPQTPTGTPPEPAFEPIVRRRGRGRSGQPSRDPLTLARRERGPCMVYRCPQPHQAHGYCAEHLARAEAEGWPFPAPRSFRPRGTDVGRLRPRLVEP